MKRSAKRMNSSHTRDDDQPLRIALRSRDSSSSHGTAKWKIVRNSARYCQPFAGARDHVRDFFDQVRRVREQVLREVEVRPEHDEREHQLAEVVEVVAASAACDIGSRLNRNVATTIVNASAASALPAHHQEPEQRRVPVRVERHDPVDPRERHRQRVEHQTGAAQPLDPHVDARRRPRPAGATSLFSRSTSAHQPAK